MEFLTSIILFVGLFFSFLVLFGFANDDFVLFRKHVVVEKVFNIGFLIFFFGLFFARAFYVFFHFAQGYFNPLVFFLFPYFSGLSISGGIIGAVLFLILYGYREKLPIGRLFDFYAVSFFLSFPIGLAFYAFGQKILVKSPVYLVSIFVSFIIFWCLYKGLKKDDFKEGSMGIFSLALFVLFTFFVRLLEKKETIFSIFDKEDALLVILFLFLLIVFIKQEKFLQKLQKKFLTKV